MFISPLLSFFIALNEWKSSFAKNIFIGVIVFIGMTALPEGDLEYYQSVYYRASNQSFEEMWSKIINLQDGKIYISLLTHLFRLVSNSHVFYFGFLYFIFGYYLVNFIYLVHEHKKVQSSFKWAGFIFLTFALSFSLRNSLNLAFYTGTIFIIYYTAKTILESNIKLLIPIIFAPLFHTALVIVFFPLVLFIFLKEKTNLCLLLVLISYSIPQSFVTGNLGALASDNKDTILESKYNIYASEGGMERLNERYEQVALNSNLELSLLNNLRDFQFNYFFNFGLIILFFFQKKIFLNNYFLQFFNVILIFWALSNLMLNISNGIRFQIFHITLTMSLFVIYLDAIMRSRVLRCYMAILFPLAFIVGIMSLYACNKFISLNFFTSNFVIEIIKSTYIESNY